MYNYLVAVFLMMGALYVVIAHGNLVKKVIGLGMFSTAVFILYITIGKVEGGSAPILDEGVTVYSNPLPHVLILTAIVVGVATTAVGLSLAVRIKAAYGTVEEDEITALDHQADEESDGLMEDES
ncbi:MAG: cation:proton antiporter subunit C [Planctomycetota bacterium]